jgi:hypothetical protein
MGSFEGCEVARGSSDMGSLLLIYRPPGVAILALFSC